MSESAGWRQRNGLAMRRQFIRTVGVALAGE